MICDDSGSDAEAPLDEDEGSVSRIPTPAHVLAEAIEVPAQGRLQPIPPHPPAPPPPIVQEDTPESVPESE